MMVATLALLLALDAPAPCVLVKKADIVARLHWTDVTQRELSYRLPQARGAVCRFEAAEGTVLVTVPDHGSSFFNNNDLVDPFQNGMGRRVGGLGASVVLFDNTAYISKRGQSVSVAVLATNGAPDERILTAFAKIVIARTR